MMLLVIIAVFATALANPILTSQPKPAEDAFHTYFAADFSQVVTTQQYGCLGMNAYTVVYIRAYSADGQGTFDPNSITNVNNAYRQNIATEVYITPNPKSSKTGAQQLTETYNGLKKGGVTVKRIWLQVYNPKNWGAQADNIKFIQSYIDQLTVLGISGGIYTSSMDWFHITEHFTGASKLKLWYTTVTGPGLNGESPQNYNDFSSFGGWVAPDVKQFGQSEALCGINPINRDIFTSNNPAKFVFEKSETPVVGRIF